MIHNILSVYRSAAPDVVKAGVLWYPNESRWMHEAARVAGSDWRTLVRVCAVLSPRVQWPTAKRYGLMCVLYPGDIKDLPLPFYEANVDKARRIIRGEPWDRVVNPRTSPKVHAFTLNLLGDRDPVTVDLWARRVALGDPEAGGPGSVPEYRVVEGAYRTAAARLGLSPRDLQAVCWVAARDHGALVGTSGALRAAELSGAPKEEVSE